MRPSYRILFCRFAVLATLAAMLCVCPGSAQTELTISAAASLKDAIVEAETTYRQSGAIVAFANNFGSSGTLATQIDQGAPVDIFISAAAKPMDDLAANGMIVTGTRRNLLRNTLVLIAPLDSKLRDFHGLTDKSTRLIALGDPAGVPRPVRQADSFVSSPLGSAQRKVCVGKRRPPGFDLCGDWRRRCGHCLCHRRTSFG